MAEWGNLSGLLNRNPRQPLKSKLIEGLLVKNLKSWQIESQIRHYAMLFCVKYPTKDNIGLTTELIRETTKICHLLYLNEIE